MRQIKLLRLILILSFLVSSQSCSHKTNNDIVINTDNSIWIGDNMLMHFNKDKIQYDTDPFFNDFKINGDTVIVDKEANQKDTLLVEALSDSILKVITIKTKYLENGDTLLLNKYKKKDTVELLYFESYRCFGSCPIQKIEIINDTLKWTGTQYLKKTGYLEIPTQNIQNTLSTLSSRLEISNIINFNKKFRPSEDAPSWRITVKHKGRIIDNKLDWGVSKDIKYLLIYLENLYLEL